MYRITSTAALDTMKPFRAVSRPCAVGCTLTAGSWAEDSFPPRATSWFLTRGKIKKKYPNTILAENFMSVYMTVYRFLRAL